MASRALWTTGDNVYDYGTAAEFTNCYATTPGAALDQESALGRSRATTTGAPVIDNLNGYNGYYGAAATDANGKSYYSYDIPQQLAHRQPRHRMRPVPAAATRALRRSSG